MANKKRKRGWSGAPAPKASSAARPSGSAAGQARSTGSTGSGSVTTSDGAATETGNGEVTKASTSPKVTGTTTPAGQATTPAATASGAAATQAASNRAARKEEARRQREALRKKEARRKAFRRYGTIAGIVVVVVGVIVLVISTNKPKSSSHPDPASLPGIMTTTAPWPPENAQLAARLDKMGLPPLGAEATDYHIHQNLQVYIHGAPESVPNGIGNISSTQLAEIHTHQGNGTIHVEAGAQRHYTLGDVFDVWGVLFTKDQLGAYKNNSDNKIRVYVNGKLFSGDPTTIPLKDQEVLVVTYGTQAEVPASIPQVFCYEQPPQPKGGTCPPQAGVTGPSGVSGLSGLSGLSGASGTSGTSGTSGASGTSGTGGTSGASGTTP